MTRVSNGFKDYGCILEVKFKTKMTPSRPKYY